MRNSNQLFRQGYRAPMLSGPRDAVVFRATDKPMIFLPGSDRYHRRSLAAFGNPVANPVKCILAPAGHAFPTVIQAFGPAGPSAPGQAAALRVAERAAKGLPRAQVHSGRLEGLRLEEPLCGFSPVIGCRAGSILSIPRNGQWRGPPYIQPMRPQPPRSGRTPPLPTRLPKQRHRRVPGPMRRPEQASRIPVPQQ
jgi:hypothetical protein